MKTLFIKNMVCMRCIRTVQDIIQRTGMKSQRVDLGEADITGEFTPELKGKLKMLLLEEGFELLYNRQSRIVEQIKNLIITEIHMDAGKKKESVNYSEFLAQQTGHEYSSLSKLFSSIEGITIEKYIIAQKIERVKELLKYDELSLSDISWKLGYSSSQALSSQFRQQTGMTPTAFKSGHHHLRLHIDHI